eukprot:8873492-Alexandrium_andersonii.AAC.1
MAIPTGLIVEDATLIPLLRAVVWSFQVLAGGVMPHTDFEGRAFTDHRAGLAGRPICGPFTLHFCS